MGLVVDITIGPEFILYNVSKFPGEQNADARLDLANKSNDTGFGTVL